MLQAALPDMSMLSPCIGGFCTVTLLSGYCEPIHCWQVVPNCFMKQGGWRFQMCSLLKRKLSTESSC